MAFKVGDIITGRKHNSYAYTTNKSLLLVTRVYGSGDMNVLILFHSQYQHEIGKNYDVSNLEDSFKHITFEEFEIEYPTCYKMNLNKLTNILSEYGLTYKDLEELPKPDVYVLSDEMRTELLEEMRTLLSRYRYHPKDEGLNKIIDEWCKNKADLIRLFEKHPNYNGKFQIAFDCDYTRELDKDEAYDFYNWLGTNEVRDMFKKEVQIGEFSYEEIESRYKILHQYYTVLDYMRSIQTIDGKSREEYLNEYAKFTKLRDEYRYSSDICISRNKAYQNDLYENINKIENLRNIISNIIDSSKYFNQFVSADVARSLNHYFPEAKIKERQKMSRAINKILCMLGVDKAPNYNKKFAKFADAINPLKIKRHTVISIHPIDFFTMSFGNSWSSCHTIDKENDRGIDGRNGFRGAHSSGTESYMLDNTSCIFYTVNGSYDGDKLELEDKINRCMFHYYDNRLVQGRVYPQNNDNGANDLYQDIREIAQKVFADILGVPNYWTNKKGTSNCSDAIYSYGTHYCDYLNFGNCNVSTLKDDREQHRTIEIGHDPICPSCGRTHSSAEYIECRYCR